MPDFYHLHRFSGLIPEIRDFAGALGGKGIKNGVFFTTSSFSRPAREYKHEGIKIVLIDGKELAKQMIT